MTLDLNKNLVMFRNEGMHIKFFSLKHIEILELVVALPYFKNLWILLAPFTNEFISLESMNIQTQCIFFYFKQISDKHAKS